MQVDVAVVGAGGAGGSVLVQLARLLPPGREPPSIAVVDPERKAGRDRTWCFWDDGSSAVDAARAPGLGEALLVDAAGTEHRLDLAPLRYVMVRSQDFYALADAAAARLGAQRVLARRDAVVDGEDVRAGAHAGGDDPGAVGPRLAARRRPSCARTLLSFSISAAGRSGSAPTSSTRPPRCSWTSRLPPARARRRLRLRAARRRPHAGSSSTRSSPARGSPTRSTSKALAGYLDARYGSAGGYEVLESRTARSR